MVLTATLCFHFALSANLWFKPALDAWSDCIDLKGVMKVQLPLYGSNRCQIMAQVSRVVTGPATLPRRQLYRGRFLIYWRSRTYSYWRELRGCSTSGKVTGPIGTSGKLMDSEVNGRDEVGRRELGIITRASRPLLLPWWSLGM
jgi:hypothetical protein